MTLFIRHEEDFRPLDLVQCIKAPAGFSRIQYGGVYLVTRVGIIGKEKYIYLFRYEDDGPMPPCLFEFWS